MALVVGSKKPAAKKADAKPAVAKKEVKPVKAKATETVAKPPKKAQDKIKAAVHRVTTPAVKSKPLTPPKPVLVSLQPVLVTKTVEEKANTTTKSSGSGVSFSDVKNYLNQQKLPFRQ